MRVAVLGTACGGTIYTHGVLRSHGLDVGHERAGPDGVVCGFAALGGRQRPEGSHPTYAYDARDVDTTIRLVRHPLDVAETLPWVLALALHPIGEEARPLRLAVAQWARAQRAQAPARRPWYARAPRRRSPSATLTIPDEMSGGLVQLALRYWVLTHEAIPVEAPVLRVSHFAEDWGTVAPILGLEATLPPDAAPRSKPIRWRRWTVDEWQATEPEWAARGLALVERYGVEPRDTVVAAAPPPRVRPGMVPAELLALRDEVARLRASVAELRDERERERRREA
ncbi:MAG: hypothetical protein KF729_38740 [Sandaracinaceae bacterium]|nr:hypothetical protein [Sandaracinaceae bacterium]